MSYYSQIADRRSMNFVPFSISDEICTIDQSTLRSFRKDARDHGHYDDFLREADESFVEEVVAAYGVSRLPVPLMVSLGAGILLPCYAVLVEQANKNSSCWNTYHAGLITIMQRVAERMGVANMLPILYMEVEEEEVARGVGEEDIGRNSSGYMREARWSLSAYMREAGWFSDLPSRSEPMTLPPVPEGYGTYTVNSVRDSSVYL